MASSVEPASAPPPALAFSGEERHPLVRALLAAAAPGAGDLVVDVHARDEMLAFLVAAAGGDRDRALATYFRSGAGIAGALGQLVRWRFGSWDGVGSLLDFASGYGRVSRFLARALPPERIWVADVYADAVRFQAERLGVSGLVSTARPEGFDAGRTFDAITVTSLFTHLPEETFGAWLRVLLGLLRPGGLLVFSTHDQSLLPPSEVPPGAGLVFQEVSESGSLATRDYGSTWVAEPWVRAALARAAGEVSAVRFPRGLCGFQDLWVVAPEPGVGFSGLTFYAEPEGTLERCLIAGDGRLELSGWAIQRLPGEPLAEVRVLLDGEPLGTCRAFHARPDVAGAFGERFRESGWGVTGALPPGVSRSAAVLIVEAIDGRGNCHVLHASSLESALLESSRYEAAALGDRVAELERRVGDLTAHVGWARSDADLLRARLAAMEASRFWKLRNGWFRVKRLLGLVDEA